MGKFCCFTASVFVVTDRDTAIYKMSNNEKLKLVKNAINEYPDFPKPGIMFQDVFGVFAKPDACQALMDLARSHAVKYSNQVDVIVGLDARGFLFGPIMALEN